MPSTVWVWKRFYKECNMEKKQQRKYRWETEPENKVRRTTTTKHSSVVTLSATVKILPQQFNT